MAYDVDRILAIATALKEAQSRVCELESQLQQAMDAEASKPAPLSSLRDLAFHPGSPMGDRIVNLLNVFPDKLFTF